MLTIEQTPLQGLLIIEPVVHADSRGYFMETFQDLRYRDNGVPAAFVQDNLAFSQKNVLRGLHFQIHHPQAKLIQVVAGEVFDVAVDVRPGSATFGRWHAVRLSAKNRRQLFVPEGFAHGYCVTGETATVIYKCSETYHPEDEGGVLWSDPEIGIDWPVGHPVVSDKDAQLPTLAALSPDQLPNVENPSQ
jgi:dTDP-4-dehydrorhamnose 3,5-epimerase